MEMEMEIDTPPQINDLLADLEKASRTPAKQRSVKVTGLVESVCAKAYEEGLPNAPLARLVDIITLPNLLDQANVGRLIRNLYPASKVPDAVVAKVVGSLGHGRAKSAYPAQAALLKWLVMVYDVLENQKILSQLYAVLFNLLDTIAIRPQLCHVLSLITRRKHVRPFRIQALMELTRQAGNEPPLVGLMRVYKDYYPDVIVGDVTAGRARVFTHPNPEWRQRLGEIQELYRQRTQDGFPLEQRTFRVARNGGNGNKRSTSSIIPETSITLEEIEDVNEFIRKLEKIELPNQLVAVVGDPLLQKFLQLKSSPATNRRIDHWLLAFFEDQLENSEGSEVKITEMLEAIRVYTSFMKYLPPACSTYLKLIIPSWNGVTNRDVILDLLSYTPIGPFEGKHSEVPEYTLLIHPELYETTFQPLEEVILNNTPESQLFILTFYTKLLDRWTITLLSSPQIPPSSAIAISSLLAHAETLCVTILQTSSSVSAHSTILTFYETTSLLFAHPILSPHIRIRIPPSTLIYTLYFTLCINTLSRLCAILAIYKRAFEAAMSPPPASSSSPPSSAMTYAKEYVNRFNGFLMDICNCLWRSRAFNTSDLNALGCLLPASVVTSLTKYTSNLDTSLSLNALFSLSYSPTICYAAIEYVRELEDNEEDIEIRHAGPVTQMSLRKLESDGGLKLAWSDYRLGVLRYLEDRGIKGVGELMYNTMKHLMKDKR